MAETSGRRVSVSGMLKKLGVSASGYKAWKRRQPSKTELRRNRVKEDIVDIYNGSHQNYGAPKITAELRKNGETIAERTVGKYMKEIGIKAQWVKPYTKTTVDPDFSSTLKNILNEQFDPKKPNAVWCSDITYIWTEQGFVYLTSIMDLYSRKIIEWTLSETLEAVHVAETVRKAMKKRNITAPLVLHSDRGSQYVSDAYRQAAAGLQLSYSKKGYPYDNGDPTKFCVKKNKALPIRQDLKQRKNLKGSVFIMEKTSKELLKEFVNSQNFTSTTDIMNSMKELFSDVLQTVMEAELEEKLGYEKSERVSNTGENGMSKNYRNGYSKKTVKTQLGEVDVKIPRDRNGDYSPQIIEKYNRNADGMEEKILALYACGMSQSDISEQIKNLYDVNISDGLVSKIVDKITPDVTAWQNRPLDAVYPFVFMDAIHYKVKENHQYITKAAYVVLGIQMDGRKDILGVWIGENESAKFWLSVMNDLKNRGIKDVYVFCVDGLTGFRETINAAFPKSQIQRCIIHQIRSSTKYVSYKDIKSLMSDLKKVYQAINEDEALNALMEFKEKWQKSYPSCVKSWEENWDILSTFFAYPAEVRKIIFTTNIIEGLNRQFRKITKNKPSFTNDDSLRKILYLASKNIVSHWSASCRNWDVVSDQLSIMFADRRSA